MESTTTSPTRDVEELQRLWTELGVDEQEMHQKLSKVNIYLNSSRMSD